MALMTPTPAPLAIPVRRLCLAQGISPSLRKSSAMDIRYLSRLHDICPILWRMSAPCMPPKHPANSSPSSLSCRLGAARPACSLRQTWKRLHKLTNTPRKQDSDDVSHVDSCDPFPRTCPSQTVKCGLRFSPLLRSRIHDVSAPASSTLMEGICGYPRC